MGSKARTEQLIIQQKAVGDQLADLLNKLEQLDNQLAGDDSDEFDAQVSFF
jgi:hypothetical protein